MGKVLAEFIKRFGRKPKDQLEWLQFRFKFAQESGKGQILTPDFGKNKPWYKVEGELTHKDKIDWLVKNVDPKAEQTIPPKSTLEAMLKDGREDLIDHFYEMHTKKLGGKPQINIDTSDLKHPELVEKMITDKKLKPTLVKTEAQIKSQIEKQNKESIKNWKDKMKDPEDFAGGGIAGMLGEPTYQDDSHRVPFSTGKLSGGIDSAIEKNKALEDYIDMNKKREASFNKRLIDQAIKNAPAGVLMDPPLDDSILRKLKKAMEKQANPLSPDLDVSKEIKIFPDGTMYDPKTDKYVVWDDENDEPIEVPGPGVKSGGRVPFSKGKKVVLEGLEALFKKFFPGTTKLGQRSKPFPEKVQEKMDLRKALADFQERQKEAKALESSQQRVLDYKKKLADENKITSHAGDLEKAGEGRFTKAEVLRQMFENTVKQSKSAKDKKMFTNFMKEIEGNPELANEPNVWNFFTEKLPKNQKLVVYGDDTVDFWRQSDFGPHNIKKTDKFMQKHPHLTREQAIKIQNMEPEDQIFEMKKIEALRKKSMHASGGLAGMLGE